MNEACLDLLRREEGFIGKMKTEIEPYVRDRMTEGNYLSKDGMNLHWLHFEADQPHKTVLLIHGFSEFWQKYYEMLFYFLQSGYSIWMPELRGHGDSEREVDDPSLVHVGSFRDYIADI